MKKYKTVPPDEVTRTINLSTKDLKYYNDLFHRILIGRKADIEFYELQEKNGSGYVFEPKFRSDLERHILAFTERLDLIRHELKNRGVNKIERSNN